MTSIGAGKAESKKIAGAGEPPRYPLAISAPVGFQVANRKDDVQQIQRALNHVLPEMGGALPLLDDDGVVGTITQEAINKFQNRNFGGADGVIEPGRRTITRIAEILAQQPGNPYGGDPALRVSQVVSRIGHASQCLLSGEAVIQSVLPFVRSGIKPRGMMAAAHDRQMALLERHFRISQLGAGSTAGLEHLCSMYQNMRSVIVHAVPADMKGPVPVAGFLGSSVFQMDSFRTDAVAYTYRHGWYREGQLTDDPPRRADRIYLGEALDRMSEFMSTEAILHELAHFVAPIGDEIADHAYGWITDPRMQALPAARRIRNAQNFATFAMEARLGQRQNRLAI